MPRQKFESTYKNLKVLVTGSTGFKGSWLCFWLKKLNARVYGVSLKPEKTNVLFDKLNLNKKINQYYLDIRDFKKINNSIKKIKPDLIFHLAAQSIVSESYINPYKTLLTNTLGSTNILESVRLNKINNLVYITSDKCYLNSDSSKSFKENDILGGKDIYSSSKASAEIIFHSYYQSFFKNQNNINKVTARAGNVIGGGDFKENRIIPDFFKSIKNKKKLIIRNPNSTRPWQHVLEPLSGYLLLGQHILEKKLNTDLYPSWNFGPHKKNCKKVIDIINMFYKELNLKEKIIIKKKSIMKEAELLSLNINKAKNELNWRPNLSLLECVKLTSDWYMNYFQDKNSEKITNEQIEFFLNK